MNLYNDFSSEKAGHVVGDAKQEGIQAEEISAAEHVVQYVFFNHQADRLPKPMSVPWPKFCEKFSHHQVRTSKDGPAWSPVAYQQNATRGNAGVRAVYLAVLDVDDGT